MHIFQVHNTYKRSGGEDVVVANEAKLLGDFGETVETHIVSNANIVGLRDKLTAGMFVGYSQSARHSLFERLKKSRPDVVHVHNTFPLLTPSVYDACADLKIPVVQTLHNFRIGCINGLLLRDGAICEKCWEGWPFWGGVHRCYRGSWSESFAASLAFARHRNENTWNRKVDRFIVLSAFAKTKFEAFGIKAEKIIVKPHFTEDCGVPSEADNRKGALFVGRLSREKGVIELVEAWREIDYPLTIIGDGPLIEQLKSRAPANVTLTGWLAPEKVRLAMKQAAILVVPSLWYEAFGLVIVEALSCGLPIIGSAIGAIPELITEKVGRLTAPGSVQELRRAVGNLINDEAGLTSLGRAARALYECRFTPALNYEQLIQIYQSTINAFSELKT